MSRAHLAKMGVDATHDLNSQVFWLDARRCLRPMLAPHLYYVLKDLLRLWEKPVRIFEVGPCFRKETQGAQHANEFTMLNLVEMGLPEANRSDRLAELAALVMKTAGISDYEQEVESSAVYGDTLDIVAGRDRLEVASGTMATYPGVPDSIDVTEAVRRLFAQLMNADADEIAIAGTGRGCGRRAP